MPHYLFQVAYSGSAVKGLVDNPQPREEIIRALFESVGGRMLHFYFCFGEYDQISLAELPNNEAAVAAVMQGRAAGVIAKAQTTVLLTSEEAVRGMQQAGKVQYKPPSTSS